MYGALHNVSVQVHLGACWLVALFGVSNGVLEI